MKATRKDYDRIARAFKAAIYLARKGHETEAILTLLAEDIADTFEAANGTFQRKMFMSACGVDEQYMRGPEE